MQQNENITRSLPAIRRDLVQARADLRLAQDDHTLVKALAEQRAIDAAGGEKGLGANETARSRALIIELVKDGDYTATQRRTRDATMAVERLEAELEDARDIRRSEEWNIRLRLCDTLDRRSIHSDQPAQAQHAGNDHPNDHAFEEAATEAGMLAVSSALGEVSGYLREMEGEPESPF